MSRRRPDVEIVSDVLVDLVHEKIVAPQQAEAAALRLGIGREDLSEAVMRRTAAGWRAPVLAREKVDGRQDRPRTEPVPKPATVGQGVHQRKSRVVGGIAELWCVGLEKQGAHWAPEDEFLVRADYPWRRMSQCDEHRKQYQRARHVKVAAREALSEVGLEFLVDRRSNLIGVVCKGCGKPFKVGDEAVGDSTLTHRGCA